MACGVSHFPLCGGEVRTAVGRHRPARSAAPLMQPSAVQLCSVYIPSHARCQALQAVSRPARDSSFPSRSDYHRRLPSSALASSPEPQPSPATASTHSELTARLRSETVQQLQGLQRPITV